MFARKFILPITLLGTAFTLNAKELPDNLVADVIGLKTITHTAHINTISKKVDNYLYKNAQGEVVLIQPVFANLSDFDLAKAHHIAHKTGTSISGVGLDAFRLQPPFDSICAKSANTTACVTLDYVYWMNKKKPTDEQIIVLVKAAL